MLVADRLKIAFRPGLRLTDEVFWRLCRANPDLRLERSAEGELVIVAPAGSDTDWRNTNVVGQLWTWNRKAKLGYVFGQSAGFTLPNTAIKGPDAAWISKAAWEALPRKDRERFAHICPEFVAEVRSKSEELADLQDKMREYIEQGARLGWLIDPRRKAVDIYRPGQDVESLVRPRTLSGGDLLPGFVLDLKGILYD